MSDPTPKFEPGLGAKPARFEIRTILLLVAGVIVLSGLYVFFLGSPTKNRAAIDSSNAPPGSIYVRNNAPAPSKLPGR